MIFRFVRAIEDEHFPKSDAPTTLNLSQYVIDNKVKGGADLSIIAEIIPIVSTSSSNRINPEFREIVICNKRY